MFNQTYLNTIFENLAQFLDIPESYFEEARSRYQAIGNWLERDESIVSQYAPEIYPQGSFLLGTVIKPITNKDEYDIDLVCRLYLSKTVVTQKKLKELIGSELADYAAAYQMKHLPEERRRSWRLNYSGNARFHLDVLPSVPEHNDELNTEIAITDNQQPNYARICSDWACCNPVGYAEWFKERMKVQLQVMRENLAKTLKARTEDVPDYKIKTPLQRVVQILKRHRDMSFDGDPNDKPISILITTLAAHAYENEADILEALVNVVTNMANFIEERDGVLWVANPINPSENFADKWQEYPQRQVAFMDWLARVEIDVLEAVNSVDLKSATKSLKRQFGENAINEAIKGVGGSSSPEMFTQYTKAIAELKNVFLARHRQTPTWVMQLHPDVRVKVAAKGERDGFRSKNYLSNGSPLPKKSSLRFTATTNAKKPYSVYWQVVNTGDQALRANQLRGGFYESQIYKGKLVRTESTMYTGTHWVECFIIQNGNCIARSGEFVVNIV